MPPRKKREKRSELPSQQIADDLRSQIDNGELLPGEQLPTVQELCDRYDVSRATVLKVLGILEAEGKIDRVPRWGTFVADHQQ